jgi:hypothetical protein
MNFFETNIATGERRIKKIAENPDPAMLKSNKLRYELERDLYLDQLEAWRNGKPLADITPTLMPLLRSMGFEHVDLQSAADRSQLTTSKFDTIRAVGLPEQACDRTIVMIAMCVAGELPVPNFLASSNQACDPLKFSYNALARQFDIPVFCIDTTLEANDKSLSYVTDQLGKLIEYAENTVPGIKYDESILIELEEADRIAFDYLKDIYELRKLVPSPISGKDAFRIPRLPSGFGDIRKAQEYFRVWSEEMHERAAKGMGSVEDEKLRVMWAVSGPYYLDVFSILEKHGVSVPWFQFDASCRWSGVKYGVYGDEKEYGRKLTPLEEQARMINSHSWGSLASRWVEDTLIVCRDLKIDAIVNFRQVGCTATVNLAKILEDQAEKELGIPVIHIEGRQLDSTYADPQIMEDELILFVDECIRRKGKNGN